MNRPRGRRGAVKTASEAVGIGDTNTSLESANTTSHTVDLPANIVSGNLLLVAFACDDVETVTFPNEGTDWVVLVDTSNLSTLKICYREADGTEGTDITVTTGSAERSAHASYRITGAEDPDTQAPEASDATGVSTTPDPPNLTPTGGAKNYLWVAVCGVDTGYAVTGYPTNYDLAQLNPSTGEGGGQITTGVAGQVLNAAAENPGTFTITSVGSWIAATVAVHPA